MAEIKPVHNFLEFIGIRTSKEEAYWVTWASILVALVLLLALSIWLLQKSFKKERKIKEPSDSLPWNQTYSVTTLAMVKFAQIILVVQTITKFGFIVALVVPDELFVKWFLIDDFHLATSICTFRPSKYPDSVVGYSLKYFGLFAPYLVIMLTLFGFGIQVIEWTVMLNIIRFQKDKTVEEIAYQIEAENVREPLPGLFLHAQKSEEDAAGPPKQELIFRKRELRWKRFIYHNNIAASAIFVICIIAMMTWVELIRTVVFLQTLSVAGTQTFSTIVYCLLKRQMKTKHKYEYERNWKDFTLFMTAYTFTNLSIFLYGIATLHEGATVIVDEQCVVVNEDHPGRLYLDIGVILFVYAIFQVPSLVFCWTVVVVKSSQDILQGISKLDYLMKTSEFQAEKGKKKQRLMTLGSVHTFVRDETAVDDSLKPLTTHGESVNSLN